MKISKLTLGTAQFGHKYGIANINGKPDFNTSIKILNFAWKNGINTFDTAPTYGNSEEIIGSFILSKKLNKKEKPVIISKLPAIIKKENLSFDNIYDYIKKQVNLSLKNLKIERIPIYLLHHAPDIFFRDGLVIECLNQIKKDGLIEKFGISAYNPTEVEASLKFKEIDVIQVPINIFDQRLIKNGLLKKLKRKGYFIFARSIYLQGLFFLPLEKLPKNIELAKEPLIKLRKLIDEYNIDIAKLAFLFIRDLPEITSLVVGTEKKEQVEENINLLKEKSLPREITQNILEEFSEIPDKVINPSLWNK